MPDTTDHFLLICSTCRSGDFVTEAQDALREKLPVGFGIRTVDCMAGCARPMTVGYQAAGKASYLFGDIETEADFEALAEFAVQYQASESGWTSATKRPKALFHKTLARLPAGLT